MDSVLLIVFVFLKILERKSDHLLLVLKGSAKRKMRKDSKVLFSLTNKSKQTFILNLETKCMSRLILQFKFNACWSCLCCAEHILSEVSAWQVWQNRYI